jgi:hypothetical protein
MIVSQKQDFQTFNPIQFKPNGNIQFFTSLSSKIPNSKTSISVQKTENVQQKSPSLQYTPSTIHPKFYHLFWTSDTACVIFLARLCCLLLILPMLFISYTANNSLLRQHEEILKTVQFVYFKHFNVSMQHGLHCQFAKFSNLGIYYAACFFLICMPVSSYVLHAFTYMHTIHWTRKSLHYIASFFCFLCIVLGNISAVLFIVLDAKMQIWGFFFLSLSMALGCIQLLFILHKKNTFQVMICTASSVLTMVLCFLAFQNYSTLTGRRFYQSATLPFYILFYETTRSHHQILV